MFFAQTLRDGALGLSKLEVTVSYGISVMKYSN